jgi:hypothetical protein
VAQEGMTSWNFEWNSRAWSRQQQQKRGGKASFTATLALSFIILLNFVEIKIEKNEHNVPGFHTI